MPAPVPIREPNPLAGLPEDVRERMARFLAAARTAQSMGEEQNFRGCMLMSLVMYADDETLDEALAEAFETIRAVNGRKQ